MANNNNKKSKTDVLFECSWEICNKVGGIYTVIMSKAALMKQHYKEYFLIGPYFEDKARDIFLEEDAPKEFKKAFDSLKKEGIVCRFGSWQIKGDPKTILIDFQGFVQNKNAIKKDLWDDFKIDSLNAGWEFEEPMMWSTAAAKLIESYCSNSNPKNEKKVAAHFHEWMAGAGILYLKGSSAEKKTKIATVFTTHATMLGRTISGSGEPLYEMLEEMDPEKEAYEHGVESKHLTEKACAENCDVFTTVSEITSIEAEKILGRKADVLVLNGLDIAKFPTYEECAIKHRKNRDVIRDFVSYYFFPHYNFDIEETLLMFIVGRYEFKNKGIDIFIKSLAKLNEMMKKQKSKKTVIAFFWIPRDVHGTKMELSSNKNMYYQIRDFVDDNLELLKERIIENVITSKKDIIDDVRKFQQMRLFDKDWLLEAKKIKSAFEKKGNPLLSTHNLPDEEHDAIMWNFVNTGLDNKEDDKVKVIFYPVYLTGVDGLIDLPYYDCITGCHLGVFPSYYEPWGYTPLESAALGVPSLTTDLGGFGRFLQSKGHVNKGVFILNRFGKDEDEAVNHFTKILHNFTLLDEKGRVREKIMAKESANLADWKELIHNYFNAHDYAIEKVWGK
ncbi:glycosyltransferase [Candidatus Woesearchaeota archaeon]|nr:glycosyltransferase [Candidatus Woesearchaeota archaeon]